MIVLENVINQDTYTNYVCEKFDIQTTDKVTTIIPSLNAKELDSFEWNIGIICGNSGCGKSTLLRSMGDIKVPTYDMSKCVCSQFPQLTEEEVCDLLLGVGLASIPTWLRFPNQLSNGERARLDICWLMANAKEGETILIDEFTSVLNRSAAQSAAYALQRYARKQNIKIIVATPHFDLFSFMSPDWCFNLNKQKDGQCEIERFVYTDSKDYEVYSHIDHKYELTNKKIID
jgi:ABC-type lipoprotein export system ATPase subunit